MQIIDWLALGIILLSAMLGLMLGFGKLLKIFTGGIVGIIISVFVTYFFIGIVASWGFVQNIMGRFVSSMESSGSKFVNFLARIGIERIILAIALFIVIQLIRIIIVRVIKGIVEIDNPIIRAINRIGGMLLMLTYMFMLTLIIFQIVYWIGGETAVSFRNYISGGLRLERLFDNNPLRYIHLKPKSK